jgi:hypothetical protein
MGVSTSEVVSETIVVNVLDKVGGGVTTAVAVDCECNTGTDEEAKLLDGKVEPELKPRDVLCGGLPTVMV